MTETTHPAFEALRNAHTALDELVAENEQANMRAAEEQGVIGIPETGGLRYARTIRSQTRKAIPQLEALLKERKTLHALKCDIGEALGGDDERPFVTRVRELRTQRDELLAALERACRAPWGNYDWLDNAQALVAKARGES